MERLTCYELSVECYTHQRVAHPDSEDTWEWERRYDPYDPFAVQWITPPSDEQMAIGALQILHRLATDTGGYHTPAVDLSRWSQVRLEWDFDMEAPLSNLLDGVKNQSVTKTVDNMSVSKQEPIWPYVLGAALLVG